MRVPLNLKNQSLHRQPWCLGAVSFSLRVVIIYLQKNNFYLLNFLKFLLDTLYTLYFENQSWGSRNSKGSEMDGQDARAHVVVVGGGASAARPLSILGSACRDSVIHPQSTGCDRKLCYKTNAEMEKLRHRD